MALFIACNGKKLAKLPYQEPSHAGLEHQLGAGDAEQQGDGQDHPGQQPRPRHAGTTPYRERGMIVEPLNKKLMEDIHSVALAGETRDER